MNVEEIIALVVLVALLGGVTWGLINFRRIRRYLQRHGAEPKSGPELNIIVLATAVVLGLTALLAMLTLKG